MGGNPFQFKGQTRRHSVGASALILTIWFVAVLSFGVLAVAAVVEGGISQESGYSHRLEARELALSGMAFGLDPRIPRGSSLLHRKEDSRHQLDVMVTSESAKLNINLALKQPGNPWLKNLLVLWGLAPKEVAVVLDSLTDWVDPNEWRSLNGAERGDLMGQSRYSLPENREFRSVSEMETVRGMEVVAERKPDWAHYFTVFGGGQIDIQDAAPDLLQAVAGLSAQQAGQVVALRNGSDEIAGTKDDLIIGDLTALAMRLGLSDVQQAALETQFALEGTPSRVRSVARVGETSYEITAIAQRAPGQAARILNWEEQ